MPNALHALPEERIENELKNSSSEYRRLVKDHQKLDHRLKEIDQIPYQTNDLEHERKEIQKLKLLNKDRRAQLVRQALR